MHVDQVARIAVHVISAYASYSIPCDRRLPVRQTREQRTEPGDSLPNASVISALAALAGAAIGGLTSVLASWWTQQIQAKVQWLAQERSRRQELYEEFIEQASRSDIDALQHDNADISALVGLYAKIGRMRILSSPRVVECAGQIAEDCRCVSGARQDLPRAAGGGEPFDGRLRAGQSLRLGAGSLLRRQRHIVPLGCFSRAPETRIR
jgi:hypothetical protein